MRLKTTRKHNVNNVTIQAIIHKKMVEPFQAGIPMAASVRVRL